MAEVGTIVHVLTQGNLANQMIQYLVAQRIASEVPGCRVSNVSLAEWSIFCPALPSTDRSEELVEGQQIDVDAICSRMRRGGLTRLNLLAFGQWMSNFPPLETCRALFPCDPERNPGYGPEYLVFNIRGGEVLDARHDDYTLLPIEFYAGLVESTGLRPVFMGQIEDNPYCHDLRSRFPDAMYRPSEGAEADFQTFRNSTNLVPCISTFSWLAAWLSSASARILLPVSGLFHPVQVPEIDLLPLDDARYEFHLFPLNYAVPVARYRSAHHGLDQLWRRVRPEALSTLRHGPKWPRRIDRFVEVFDEQFYLETYADVAAAVGSGHIRTGLDHYRSNGFAEQRQAFAFDRRWYSRTYPLAAFETGQGDYETLAQHYAEVGALRGYRPTSSPGQDDQPWHGGRPQAPHTQIGASG